MYALREYRSMIKSVNNYPISQLFDIEAGVIGKSMLSALYSYGENLLTGVPGAEA